MPKGKKNSAKNAKAEKKIKAADYRHEREHRKNIPTAMTAAEGAVPYVAKAQYAYSPHLSPQLRFDPDGKTDRLISIMEKAKGTLSSGEMELMNSALTAQQPWLEWAGKKEQHDRGMLEVDPVALHIHERVSAKAILHAAMREDVQKDLFADPQMEYKDAVKFYQHDVDWANRLILGDSLQVMSSLARRENLAGKVQMIYIDPPYGIKFASNFQPEVGRRDVKEKEQDLTREPEMVRAYRDTWQLGVHSYLSYLRDRLISARELLAETGSVFVQISDENVHRIRLMMDEIFGHANFCGEIAYIKTSGLTKAFLPDQFDLLLWYAKDASKAKYMAQYSEKSAEAGTATNYGWVLFQDGTCRGMSKNEKANPQSLPTGAIVYKPDNITSSPNPLLPFGFEGKTYGQRWKTNIEGLRRLGAAGRLHKAENSLQYLRKISDFPCVPITKLWDDTATGNFTEDKLYVVQTGTKAIARCLLMTTDPGDLVLDPTCGSGTTAYVAEQWGRRWITIDTSRVALSIARQRLLTGKYDYFDLRDEKKGPFGGFNYMTVPHITLKSIAQNRNLDPIFEKHVPILDERLAASNKALAKVKDDVRQKLKEKIANKQKTEGKRAITDADRRRWDLPARFEHWTMPFDMDPDWPAELQSAVTAYRQAWRAKMDEVTACINDNAEQEELVDKPEVVKGVVRVSGPFTVEGVRPEELSLGEKGTFDPTPNEWEAGHGVADVEVQNIISYLTQMVKLLKMDGVTFPNNKNSKFDPIEPLFDRGLGNAIHAEGNWQGTEAGAPNKVAIAFGPQYGPVTAQQVEDLIRASKRYDELVIAGFSFDAAAVASIQESQHPKLKVHMAHIRPDVSPGMAGLLKDTPNSQLFTVFGTPEISVKKKGEDYVVKLKGVDIYDPLTGEVRSTGADKVAAWFLDSDYDGRCFCITQAFFPDQDAWDKIAKSLGSKADAEVFEAFKGTESIPFKAGKFNRIAVKVIDPRGNEVMTIDSLKDVK